MEKFDCLGVKIDNCTLEQVLNKIPEFLASNKQHRIATINAEYILEAEKDKEFREAVNSADLRVADGIGPIWAAKFLSLPASKHRILRYPQVVVQYIYSGASLIFWPKYCRSILQERVGGVDLIRRILEIEKQRDKEIEYGIFLLGGYNSEKIRAKYPNTNIVGTFEGSPGLEHDETAREEINRTQPNVLFVAYGNPASKQEKWISRNLRYLPSVKLAMGAGGSFDFLSEQVKRAPRIMQKLGLEWLFRLFKQPGRVGRIWNAVVIFSFKVLKERMKTNLGTNIHESRIRDSY